MFYTACYRLVFFVFRHFFFQFATSFLSAVRWGRQALWLVLAVRLAFLSDQPMCLTTKRGLVISYLLIFQLILQLILLHQVLHC